MAWEFPPQQGLEVIEGTSVVWNNPGETREGPGFSQFLDQHHLGKMPLDVLDELEKLKICIGYRYEGELLEEFPTLLKAVWKCQPVYEEMEGWKENTSLIRDYDELPRRAKEYLQRIAELVKADVSLISVGPGRKQTIVLKSLM